ncbi:unnamed protein product [Spirodela intermedia]|uniref:Uncharacterized protein n=1 Tax=Spirodela intermedia TaxID=51605 RepID=A0A7I8IL23_SPIIN|nr:unnamed protein product [Spirodela intermedia]CAA6658601.1 unnamed protein product [Spirodela intermedia]
MSGIGSSLQCTHRSLFLFSAIVLLVGLCSAAEEGAAVCRFSVDPHADHHHHDHEHDRSHHHDGHNHGCQSDRGGAARCGHDGPQPRVRMLPEELAEEEDLNLEGCANMGSLHHHHNHHHHNHHHHEASKLSALGLWVQAMGCSLLVSMASLVCLILLPLFFFKGRPSKLLVDSLAVFGAGAMLGDAFLHQLPHAFGGEDSHGHDHHEDYSHNNSHRVEGSHSHSLKDLSVGLSVLAGILLFLLVEKMVRYIEHMSGEDGHVWRHAHHHHRHHDQSSNKKHDDITSSLQKSGLRDKENKTSKENCQGVISGGDSNVRKDLTATDSSVKEKGRSSEMLPTSKSSLVFGYLNLFSDGVHNFTDGMALGSAFLLHGSVGGWSTTLFLLAHELPKRSVGDFGILVRSGFSVSKALFFNFLSALVALAGTALALLLGKDPGHSSLIEGFTAGGFVYIAVAGVLPEMNNGNSTIKGSALQIISFILGMAVALCISLIE